MGKKRSPPAVVSLPAVRHGILARTVRHTLLITAVSILATSLVSFLVAESFLEQRVFAQLSSLASAKEDLIERRLQTDRERTALLASRSEIQNTIAGSAVPDTLAALLQALLEEGVPLLGITVFDTEGATMAAAGSPIAVPGSFEVTTRIVPVIDIYGWQGHVVYAPVSVGGIRRATLAVRYETFSLLGSLLDAAALGNTGEVMLAREQNGELVLLHHESGPRGGRPLVLGPLPEQEAFGEPLARALSGGEGVLRNEDYTGKQVFAAYRALPSLGWGLAIKVDTQEALHGINTLAALLTVVGLLLLAIAAVLATVLARHLTGPLRRLAGSLNRLGPGHWDFMRSVQSGDEVEVLDHVIADLTERLRRTYEHLEDEVAARTKELKEQYAKDRAILDTIEHGVLMMDGAGTVTEANPAAVSLLGFAASELLGRDAREVLVIQQHRTKLSTKEHPVTLCLEKRLPYHLSPDVRLSIVRKDHTVLPVILTVTPLLQGKRCTGAIAVFQDITELRRLDYMKSEFISLASHQLRTPLSSMMWYVELLTTEDSENLTESQRSYIAEMQNASKRMVNLVDALLHASRLEGGGITPAMQEIDLAQIVRDAAEDMRSVAKDRKIAVVIDVTEKSIRAQTDPMLLTIVLQNAFSNAVKYSKPGGTIHVALQPTASGLEITVSDTGIGIPKADMTHLFQKLFRAQNVLKTDTDGSGLGLYISRMVMANLGGDIRIQSIEGKGTTVTIQLPLSKGKTSKKKEA